MSTERKDTNPERGHNNNNHLIIPGIWYINSVPSYTGDLGIAKRILKEVELKQQAEQQKATKVQAPEVIY